MLGQLGNKNSRNVASPSRTYIAMCNRSNFDGYYFRKFILPERNEFDVPYDNNCGYASWYFLNVLDGFSCIEGCFAAENWDDLKTVPEEKKFKILAAAVKRWKGFSNKPELYILVENIPQTWLYEKRGGIYYAESEGKVSFYFYEKPGSGYGGSHIHVKMKDGTEETLIGPWSSRAGVANKFFPHCVEVIYTTDARDFKELRCGTCCALTLEMAQEAAKLAGVTLVKTDEGGETVYRIQD